MNYHEMLKLQSPFSPRVEEMARQIVDSAFQVHKTLGPGLLESVYEGCLAYELIEHGLSVKCQEPLPVFYKELEFDNGFRMDILVEDTIVIELKAVEAILPVHQAQLMTYLKLSGKYLGFLINFNVPLIKDGIKRIVL